MVNRLLIVEADEALSESLKGLFKGEGYEVDSVGSASDALKVLGEQPCDAIIADINLPGTDGIELLEQVKGRFLDIPVILITAQASLDTAVKALRAGAYDYMTKPLLYDELRRIVKEATNERPNKREKSNQKRHIGVECNFGKIVGESEEISSVISEAKKIANSMSNVLLLGETGTGKELFAKAIHSYSTRRDNAFVPINCSAIPETLLESELFGYTKGAFTGATTSKRGLFEEADGGTIFLDEIGDLGQHLQTKLLRVLDDKEIRPVGSIQGRTINVRFVSATNRDLAKSVKEGKFREDLYYRINVITLKLPPLRGRGSDVRILAEHFVRRYAGELGKPATSIDDRTMNMLQNYRWPGNVRELQNVVERAVLIADTDTIMPEHLAEPLRMSESPQLDVMACSLSIEEYTKEFILRHQSRYNEQKIAEMLGITRKALWEKRKRWGLNKP